MDQPWEASKGRPIQFMGTYQSRLDVKGRMSIPAPFRASLRSTSEDGSTMLVLRPSHALVCVEVWPYERYAVLTANLEKLDPLSRDEEELATTFFSDAWQMEPDKEGRIVLPEMLVEHAGLAESVTILGLGNRFQIWEPGRALERRMTARTNVAARGLTVTGAKP